MIKKDIETIQKHFFPNGIIANFEVKDKNVYFDVILKKQLFTNFSTGLEITHIDFRESTISFFISADTELRSLLKSK